MRLSKSIAGAALAGSCLVQQAVADESAVLGTIEAMTSAFAVGDIDGIMATYDPEAVVIAEPGKPVTGDAALREMFAAFVAAGVDFSYGAHEVVRTGDTALHLMKWTATAPDGMAQSALSVAVLRRQQNGEWKMVIDHPFGNGVMTQ